MPVRTVNLVAIRLIAACAMNTRAKCQFDYKHLTPGNSFGYTSAKSTAKKAVAGCGSPKARGAEPHPARFAAFLFQATSYGGPNGRAQALPVTLRVPRSSTPVRAAAQCGSWSAVVHLARLEINMEHSTTAHELRIRFHDHRAVWLGTRIQLEAEGFLPPKNEAWPSGRNFLRIELGKAWACVYRADAARDEPTPATLYRVHHYSNGRDYAQRTAARKIKEAATLLSIGGPDWHKAYDLHWKARCDDKFQEFKRTLLGQKKRGRKPGATNQRKEQA